MFRKNVAGQFIHFQGVDATTGGIKSGVSWTVRRCIDGTFAAATGTASEDGTTGWYKFALSQADTNGNNIGFNFTGSGAVPQTVNIVTTDLNPYDAVRAGLTALPNAAAEAAGGLYTRGTGAGQINQPANGMVDVNAVRHLGTAYATPTVAGVPEVDITHIDGTAHGSTQIRANAVQWAGSATATTDIALKDTLAKTTDITGFNDLSAAQVNAEVVDALNVDTYAEPGQGAPVATTTLQAKIAYLYKFLRNRITQTSTTLSVYNDDAVTVDQKSTVSDNGTTYDRGEIASGP